jgi:hypothetical protein
LDFLRSSAELTNWYGRTYVYCGNPLMLPFKYETAYAQLGFEGKVCYSASILFDKMKYHSIVGISFN